MGILIYKKYISIEKDANDLLNNLVEIRSHDIILSQVKLQNSIVFACNFRVL